MVPSCQPKTVVGSAEGLDTYLLFCIIHLCIIYNSKIAKEVRLMKSAGFNNPSSIQRAITRMIKLNILFETGGEYRFVNPFFRAWLPYRG